MADFYDFCEEGKVAKRVRANLTDPDDILADDHRRAKAIKAGNKGEKLMVNDVSRAFFCAPARRQIFVELPAGDSDSKATVGELNYSMYGTRDAAQIWGEECAGAMVAAGFVRGKA